MGQEIVIAGAGVAGLLLAEKLGERDDTRVTVVAPDLQLASQIPTQRRV